jgi:uncharacterized protein
MTGIITSSFKPAWWLRNCHAQTIYPSLFRNAPVPPDSWRERLITPDGDFLDVDFCGSDTSWPLVIVLHGLTGSSQSGYIRGLQTVLRQSGFRSAALNFRGCSGQSNNKARSYHSGETEDVDFLYRTLRQREPQTRIAAAGFSLGGNALLKWLGEQGTHLDLFAAVAVSVPLLLGVCATRLDSGFAKIYRTRLLAELKAYMRDKLAHLEAIGDADEAEKVRALGDLSGINSFWQYDDRVVARLHGFRDVHDYYQRSSSRQYLKSITVPTLIIQSSDDPFMTPEVLPERGELSRSTLLELAENGGHVGFAGGNNPFRPVFWIERRICEYLAEQIAAA